MGTFFVDCVMGEHLENVLQTLYIDKKSQCVDILIGNDEEVCKESNFHLSYNNV